MYKIQVQVGLKTIFLVLHRFKAKAKKARARNVIESEFFRKLFRSSTERMHDTVQWGRDRMVLIRATGKSFLKRPQLDYGPSQAPLHRRGLFSKTISHSNFMIQGAQKHVDVP